ncbi:MAG: DUF2335 domain-containing protein [Desulfobulbaceae bacterium]|jgi:uncharacterized membrane protein|nr:DUF2335 domain-containing protein [Desulfobulbaceae bacterium]
MSSNKTHTNKSKKVPPSSPKPTPQAPTENQVLLHQLQIQHQGPIPAPAILQQYDDIIPGAAERILQMAEQDAAHQHAMHRNALDAQRFEVRRGQIFGFGIGLAALSASIIALVLGYPTTAGILGGTTVVGLVTVFVKERSSAPSEEVTTAK